jgi:Skp family chaperone for outer membrane proteins
MRIDPRASAVIAVILVGALAVRAGGQDKAPGGGRSGVLNLRDALDKSRNQWIAEIEQEIQKLQESEAGRATDLNPQERNRIRTKIQDLSNRRRLEVYSEVVRLSGLIAKERGFDLVQRADRMPMLEAGEADLNAQIERRAIVHYDPAIDITAELLDRINKEHPVRKK